MAQSSKPVEIVDLTADSPGKENPASRGKENAFTESTGVAAPRPLPANVMREKIQQTYNNFKNMQKNGVPQNDPEFIEAHNFLETIHEHTAYANQRQEHARTQRVLSDSNVSKTPSTNNSGPSTTLAILDADETALRHVLMNLMLKGPIFETEIRNLLLMPADAATSGTKRKSSEWTSTNGPAKKPNTGAILVKRYRKCAQCNKQFDPDSNVGKLCHRHPGEVEVIEGGFPDDDEMTYEPPRDLQKDWRWKACPDQFVWTCCEGDARAKPCRKGRHSEVNNDDGEPGSSESEEEEDEDEDEDE